MNENMIEKLICVKFYFQKQDKYISIYDSSASEIATWTPIQGLEGLEDWSLNEQLAISNHCIEVWVSN